MSKSPKQDKKQQLLEAFEAYRAKIQKILEDGHASGHFDVTRVARMDIDGIATTHAEAANLGKQILSEEELTAFRDETQKILKSILAQKATGESRTDTDIAKRQAKILEALQAMGEHAAAQGLSDEELEKLIDREVSAVRAKRAKSDHGDTLSEKASDEK